MFKRLKFLIQNLFKKELSKDEIKRRLTTAYTLAMADALSVDINDQKENIYKSLETISDPTKADEIYISHVYKLIEKSLYPVYEVMQEVQLDFAQMSYEDFYEIEKYRDKLYVSLYMVIKDRIDLTIQKIASDILGLTDLKKIPIVMQSLTDEEN